MFSLMDIDGNGIVEEWEIFESGYFKNLTKDEFNLKLDPSVVCGA